MAMDEDGVGYGKPPTHSRWKKGQSGNPKGRAKGARGLRTDLDEELKATLVIKNKEGSQELKGTAQQLMLRTLARRAARGDVRASRLLIDLILQIFGSGDRGGEREKLSAQDQALLEQWLGQMASDEDEGRPKPPQTEADGGGDDQGGGAPPTICDDDDGEEENPDGPEA